MYRFDTWTAVNVVNGKQKTVKRTIYEETADADHIVRANYKKQAATAALALGVPDVRTHLRTCPVPLCCCCSVCG